MEPDFWHQRWQQQQIGFHLPAVNPHLHKHFSRLKLAPNARVLLPLCGKTRDIGWLLQQGMQVVGVELSALAVEALFAEAALNPHITQRAGFVCYQAPGLVVWQGDFFALTPAMLGPMDAVYDRAALIALPPAMRVRYAQQLQRLAPTASQLIVTLDYDQRCYAGPPFSVPAREILQHYAQAYAITALDDVNMAGGLKGLCPAQEQVWQCVPHAVPLG